MYQINEEQDAYQFHSQLLHNSNSMKATSQVEKRIEPN